MIKTPYIDYTLLDPNPGGIDNYEKSRIIGTRAKQLENNSHPLIDIGDEVDFINIAMMEYDAGKLSMLEIVKKYPDGSITIT